MVDVQIRFSAEVLPFAFEPERKERLLFDVQPSQYYPQIDLWEESPSEPQIQEEKRENADDSNWEKPKPVEIDVNEHIKENNNKNHAEKAAEEADAEFEFYAQQIAEEIALDKELEFNDYLDYDEYEEYEEDFEIAFFHSKKATSKRLRNTSHYKKEKINIDRCVNAYT